MLAREPKGRVRRLKTRSENNIKKKKKVVNWFHIDQDRDR